jgi:GxxExxY protein
MDRTNIREFDLPEAPPEWNRVTGEIIRAAMAVHSHLGPIGLESVFERALVVRPKSVGLSVNQQVPVPLRYLNQPIGKLLIDALVENLVVFDLKFNARSTRFHSSSAPSA